MKIAEILDELDLFQEFTYPELEHFAPYLQLEAKSADEVIFREGDTGKELYILISGSTSILKGYEHGCQLMAHELRGQIIGEMAMIDHATRSATCIAETDCELLTLTATNMDKFAKDHPDLAYRFMACLARKLSRRLRRASTLMADFLGA
ncbi:MAG: cyclic nucleotide-binding domain-containing protein [Pseudomonadota bacterium]